MTEPDGLVPKRPVGRPVRRVERGLDQLPGARADTPRCAKCGKWDRKTLWCPIRAAPNSGRGPMCKYGIVLYRARKQKERRDGQ